MQHIGRRIDFRVHCPSPKALELVHANAHMGLGAEMELHLSQRLLQRSRATPVSRAMLLKYVTAAMRTSRVIERRLLVVTNWLERGVLVHSIGCIARDDKLEQKEARDRCNNDGIVAPSVSQTALLRGRPGRRPRMLEPQYAALKRMHIFEFGRDRKADEHLDESTGTPVATARRRSFCVCFGVE
jgi:hypothetical protein